MNFSTVAAAKEGAESASAECEVVRLCDYKLIRCMMCDDGWDQCPEEHTWLSGKDGFSEIQRKIAEANAGILDTFVYWWDMTEAMEAFFDRFRRREARKGDEDALTGKPTPLICSPGGAENGMIPCLEQRSRLCRHLRAEIFDYVDVSRWKGGYKLPAIRAAAAAMARRAKNA